MINYMVNLVISDENKFQNTNFICLLNDLLIYKVFLASFYDWKNKLAKTNWSGNNWTILYYLFNKELCICKFFYITQRKHYFNSFLCHHLVMLLKKWWITLTVTWKVYLEGFRLLSIMTLYSFSDINVK